MRLTVFLSLLSLSLLVQAASLANTDVHFSRPEKFTDAHLDRDYGRGASESVLAELKGYIERLGELYLQPGQRLQVDVLDIDLAGNIELLRGGATRVRIMREITWPRIELHYTLASDGQAPIGRDALLEDKNYLLRRGGYGASDRLRYEKAMLEEWFRKTFGTKPDQGSRY